MAQTLREFVPVGDHERDRPLYVYAYAELLQQCREGLARREAAYPEWIRAGRIADDEARRDIEGWKLLVAEWEWIVEGTGDLPPRHTLDQRIDAVNLAIERVSGEVRRRGGHDILRQSHILQALLWHLVTHRFGAPAVHFFAGVTRAARAEAAAGRAAAREAA